jgi:cold shock CspA family protein
MGKGTVTRLVRTHGSTWGRIRPQGDSRDLFFNVASLVHPADFTTLMEGNDVEFDEEADQVNGAHAVHVVPSA